MNFYGDYHTHTFYSDGRNGVSDVADGALSKGLKEVAITDHGFYNRFLSLTPEKYRKQQEEIEKQLEKQLEDKLEEILEELLKDFNLNTK